MSESPEQSPAPDAPQTDPAQPSFAMAQLRSEQNLGAGVVVGGVAALVGAGVWAGITVFTDHPIGFMAIGIGIPVGFAVRNAGKGIDGLVGYAGAALSRLGCALGNLLAVCGFVAQDEAYRCSR